MKLALALSPLLVSAQDKTVTCTDSAGTAKDIHFHDLSMDWGAAETYCIENYIGGNLVSILDAQTNECVSKQVLSQGADGQSWIGLTDEDPYSQQKLDFRWTANPDIPIVYENWNPGEPADSDERCGRMYGGGMGGLAGKWNNDLCSKAATFACQGAKKSPADPTPAPPAPTPQSAPKICVGRTFHFHETQMDWGAAEKFCMEVYGGNLATVSSAAINDCITKDVMPDGTDDQAWIGLTDDQPYSPTKMDWRWTSDPDNSVTYTNWNINEPADSEERCGRIYGPNLGELGGKWNNDLCAKLASFICELPGAANPTPAPPPPTPDPGTKCDKRVFHYHPEQLNWEDAQAVCNSTYKNGELASIQNQKENDCIAQRIVPQGPDDQVWIGLTDDAPYSDTRGTFVWSDGKKNKKAPFYNWAPGEPADSEEQCGRMYGGAMGAIGGSWNNDLCTKTAAFVCGEGAFKSGSSGSNTGEIAGAVVGVLLVLGAAVGCFIYSKRSGTVGGLNTKFMVSARSNRGAL